MDEVGVNLQVQPQSSICSDSNGEDHAKGEASASLDRRICLLGALAQDQELHTVASTFGVPILTSETGDEYIEGDSCGTVFVIENFEGDVYNKLCKAKQPLLGPPALKQLANQKKPLPDGNTRPLFNLAMKGVVACFTGFKKKDDLTILVPLIHHMGGSIRKEMTGRVTHLIANVSGGEKYQYAVTFRVPVVHLQWVHTCWERRYDLDFSAKADSVVAEFKLQPFHGAKVCFVGFPEEEEKHMTEVLLANGGSVTNLDDQNCTHVVMEHSEVITLEASNSHKSSQRSPTTQIEPSTTFTDNYLKHTPANNALGTLHEKTDTNDAYLGQKFDLNASSISLRKRKNESPNANVNAKRKREKFHSEKKKKVSDFFKTPINYFSQRRRTIDANFNQSLNESVVSASGLFSVDTVHNLSSLTETQSTPVGFRRARKKNIFTRTFSSAKFAKNKSKKSVVDLNVTELSFGEVSSMDGAESLNTSCFPDISLNPFSQHELRNELTRGPRGLTVPSVVVVDESSVSERPDISSKAWIVKAEWFWTSVQKEINVEEKEYLFDDYIEQVLSPSTRRESHQATPSSASRRKRKRLHETLQSLVHQQSPSLHKRRSSVSDAGLLSVSGSFIDSATSPDKALLEAAEPAEAPRKALTPRHQVFLELLQTETNYVDILHTIMTMFKKHLEEMQEEEALLNNIELNLIFGKIPSIYEIHVKMLDELRWTSTHWAEDRCIGNIIVKFSTELLKAYPPFINYFEEMKEVLTQCDQTKPRFHAFLKACQTRPECGRQSLQELMIRPVQRLGSISLLLNDILKHTPKTNPDHAALDQALAALREVMMHINEDKRKTEGQVTLFNIFNDIDNCPPDIVSSHRNFITKTEVIQLSSSEGLSNKGNSLVLFLFSDQMEVCKKKSKAYSLKSPSGTGSLQNKPMSKPYKHVRMLPLNTIKRVIDIKETEDCQKVFSLVCRHNNELKEKLYSFAMADEDADKTAFLKTLTRQMANNACTADADKFLAYLEPQQLDIDTSDLSNGTLSKAFKFASRTRLKVGRAFSFNKTPSKLKRAVSSMMSPFGSTTNLTPASQLAQMRLASYNNINELGNAENAPDSPPVAPMSVQPTRKMKCASLGSNALKRL